ncbi:MAG: GspE/PulE family protein [Candidatus Binatia bacterium]
MVPSTIGQYLVRNNFIDDEQLKMALHQHGQKGGNLLEHLTTMGFLDEVKLASHLAQKFNLRVAEDSDLTSANKMMDKIPDHLILKYEILPLKLTKASLTIAASDPFNLTAFNEIKFATGFDVVVMVAKYSAIKGILKKLYEGPGEGGGSLNYDDLLNQAKEEEIKVVESEEVLNVQSLEKMTTEKPIVTLFNTLVIDAIKKEASDIHIEPQRKAMRIRFRIDGMLQEVVRLPINMRDGLISRVKVMARLDIAERRVPQDGKIRLNIMKREVDMRVSTLPTPFGESVVIRILDRLNMLLDLDLIGFAPSSLPAFKSMIHRPHGIILVTGPTGSGKTTTLYASLNHINTLERSLFTIEDPVEYELPGVRQVHVNLQAGLTFARGLRAMLRQDPDIIMVGEIRDGETAEIAVQAALTGHLVFSTLHTNDASGAITRLIEMGVQGHLVKSALLCVVAQRLLRRLCLACVQKSETNKGLAVVGGKSIEGDVPSVSFKPVGCEKCSNTGFKGRVGVYEYLEMNDKIRSLNLDNVDTAIIREAAINDGLITLHQDGIEKVQAGLTTMDEVLRVVPENE